MDAIRVIHAVRSDAFAGVERHIAVLARAQVQSGHDVLVVGGHTVNMAAACGPSVPFVPASSTTEVVRRLRQAPRADLVHAHMTAAEVAAIAIRRGSKLVTTRHFAARRQLSGAGSVLSPLIQRRMDAQIAISRFVADSVEGPSSVVYAGVKSRPRLDEGARERVVLVVQRLAPEKQTDVAIRAFVRSGLAAEGWQLQIAGSGSQRGALQRLARDLGAEPAVTFLGFQNDVGSLMSRASIFMATAPSEPFGLSVLEAMASGLPVVASRGGGHLETVGLAQEPQLFTVGATGEAADLLRSLACSESLRLSYGTRLRDIQRSRFTPELQAEATDAVYEAVLG